MPNPKFIRHRITGIVYDFNPAALKRPENDYEPYEGEPEVKGAAVTVAEAKEVKTAEAESTEEGKTEGADGVGTNRKQAIIDAVKAVNPADYSAPAGGRPAMPKVGAISDAVGFKVSADEVAEAVSTITAAAPQE